MILSPVGEKYIGITTRSFRLRMTRHLSQARFGSKTKIAGAFREHGRLMRMIPLLISADREYLLSLEPEVIRVFSPELNMAPGGRRFPRSTRGRVRPQCERDKISAALHTRVISEETRNRLSNSAKRRGPNRMRPISIAGVQYCSGAEVARAYRLSEHAVWNRVKSSNYPEWVYGR
jgi:hypothetical protein